MFKDTFFITTTIIEETEAPIILLLKRKIRILFSQVSSGMVGMLIVEDDPDSASELGLISCPNNCHNDHPHCNSELPVCSHRRRRFCSSAARYSRLRRL